MLDHTWFEKPGKMSFGERIVRYLRQFKVLMNLIGRAQEAEDDIQNVVSDGDPHTAYQVLVMHQARLGKLSDKVDDWFLAQYQHVDDMKAFIIRQGVATGKLPGLPGEKAALRVARGVWEPGDVITIEGYKLFPDDAGRVVLMAVTKSRAVIPIDHLERLTK